MALGSGVGVGVHSNEAPLSFGAVSRKSEVAVPFFLVCLFI